MGLFTEEEVLNAAFEDLGTRDEKVALQRAEMSFIAESVKPRTQASFDIFLSHSFADKLVIYGLYKVLTVAGFKVYVDWIQRPTLNRTNVTPATANIVRKDMQLSETLLFATTPNYSRSAWMPWECGYFDGLKGRVAILPVVKSPQTIYKGQEYLGLYYFCSKIKGVRSRADLLICNQVNSSSYVTFDRWVKGSNP